FGSELRWALSGPKPDAIVCCAETKAAHAECLAWARTNGVKFLAATTMGGGWIGSATPSTLESGGQHPISAMLLAALLADSIREILLPMWGGVTGEGGSLRVISPSRIPDGMCVLVGAGGIGVFAATLAAALGCKLSLIDFDRVEESNLNRQGLFTTGHAQQRAYKAEAARDALVGFFPGVPVVSSVSRVGSESAATILAQNPSVILSAVDNASTRLALSSLGHEIGVPVVQGGTDVFAADSRRRDRGCAADPSYVVPGMLAGAFMVHRMLQACELYRGLFPIRWRSGCLPVEERKLCDFDFKNLIAGPDQSDDRTKQRA
ncbi:MAG: ThiF family adenylyltransferase, partial [Acidobacteria bacterium]|nr:ThiF family adenylyltransferase [Acidobacteriota bacterium]